MKRKTFLKVSSAFIAGSMLPSMTACKENPKAVAVRKNWAGNYQYKAKDLHQPKTVEDIQALVRKLDKQKALGSCHCFNNIADSPLNQISTQHLTKLVSIDEKAQTVTVESGVRYGQLAPELDAKGYALHNLASLPHISVAGACSTATHGSGVTSGNLASAVAGIEFVNANGDIVQLNRGKDADFEGAVVSLGGIGVITKVTLDIQKTYQVRQDLFQDLPVEALKAHFKEIMSSGYSVSLFTDWQNNNISQIWIKRRVEKDTKSLGSTFYGAKAATKNLHPITALSAENCTAQMGVAGVWYERLPHFKMGFTPSSGEELQAEFFVPLEQGLEAYLAIEKLGAQIFPQLMISEIRTIKADNLWMSTAYKRDSMAIHFTWKQHTPEVMALLPIIEAALAPFQYRPHWGKLFTIAPADLHTRYEKYSDFLQLLKKYDPQGKFRNPYLDLNIYPA